MYRVGQGSHDFLPPQNRTWTGPQQALLITGTDMVRPVLQDKKSV